MVLHEAGPIAWHCGPGYCYLGLLLVGVTSEIGAWGSGGGGRKMETALPHLS